MQPHKVILVSVLLLAVLFISIYTSPTKGLRVIRQAKPLMWVWGKNGSYNASEVTTAAPLVGLQKYKGKQTTTTQPGTTQAMTTVQPPGTTTSMTQAISDPRRVDKEEYGLRYDIPYIPHTFYHEHHHNKPYPAYPSDPYPGLNPALPFGNCTCVPFDLCDETGFLLADGGAGWFDVRKGIYPCTKYNEVCCFIRGPTVPPPTTTTTTTAAPTTTTTTLATTTYKTSTYCGIRKVQGVNSRALPPTIGETNFGEYPWMVAILEKTSVADEFLYVCGGALIRTNVVLTAAHCVRGRDRTRLTIRLGEWDTQSTNEFFIHQDVNVSSIKIHPEFYSGGLYNDVGLVFLEPPASLMPHIDLVCLPYGNVTYDLTACYATGWGKDAFGYSGNYQTILKEVKLSVVEREPCQVALRRTKLGNNFNLHRSFICAGGKRGVDTCTGDGGSPLVCPFAGYALQYAVIGVVSWGIGCGEDGIPGVYVDLRKFLLWIDLTIAAENSRITTTTAATTTTATTTTTTAGTTTTPRGPFFVYQPGFGYIPSYG